MTTCSAPVATPKEPTGETTVNRGLSLLMANGRDTFVLNVDLNWRVLAVTMGLALLTGLLFGLAPAAQSTKVDLTTALKQTRAGEAKRRIGSWLRVIQLVEGRIAGCGVPALHVRLAEYRPADLRAAGGGRPDEADRRGAGDRKSVV